MAAPADQGSANQEQGMRFPIVDLHCDLLSYLATVEGATAENTEDIGCAIPFLHEGNVKLQIMAAYVPTEPHSAELAMRECELFTRLPEIGNGAFSRVVSTSQCEAALRSDQTGIVAALENASSLCTESEPLDLAFARLEEFVNTTGRLLYITLTHHGANRFGGGNMTDIGLKDDGKILLEYVSSKRLAIDLSHTSDALARGILDHIDSKDLDIPLLASHSNFRSVFDHARNLPDWLATEIVTRGGVIGVNFIRAFVHPDDPSYLVRHIQHGFESGAGDHLCFGADYFYWKGSLDQGRVPFYHPEHANAGKYQTVLNVVGDTLGDEAKSALAYRNAMRFLERIWK